MKNIESLLIIAALLTGTSFSYADAHMAAPAAADAASTTTSALPVSTTQATSTLPLVNAEVRKVDIDNKKISLKHGEIKNLNMPGMTMVFVVKDAKLLDDVKTGDKVSFTADHINGVFTVLSIKKSN